MFFFFFKKPKRIYLVRHGETENNAAHVRQGPEGKLSEKGREQALFVGARLSNFPIQIIISSPYERTVETSKIISKELNNKKIEYTDLLKERRNPSEIVGKRGDDPEVKKIVDLIDKSFHTNDLRYSDEENFEDMKERASKLLDFIAKRKETQIVIVTHAIFLKMVVSFMLYREKLTAEDYARLSFHNPMNNAGITLCEYVPKEKKNETKGWKVLAWNDYGRDIESKSM
ncbi:MAG: histidine phosphatase family protein [Candidatus Paceibacterota bacterium]